MEFTKMIGAGNDFILFNGDCLGTIDYGSLAKKICDRHFGVGADGIMICEKSDVADIEMIYYNSDGSQGEMCGNGIRCFSKFIYENHILHKDVFNVETLAGIKTVCLEIDNLDKVKTVKVDMGYPVFEGEKIPVDIHKDKVILENIKIDEKEITFSSVLLGVPHTTIFIKDIYSIDINGLGRKIENHPLFPQKTNVNFVQVVSRNRINIYTWERGAGRTLGCGTGSCASVVLGNVIGKLDNIVNVKTEGGDLQVQIMDDYKIFMKGNAMTVCKGEFFNF